MSMTSRERVLAALHGQQPDRVPYCELAVDRALAQRLMGWGEPKSQAANLEAFPYTLEESLALADFLKLDNLTYALRAPVYAHKVPGLDGRLFYGEGMIHSRADMAIMDLPDPHQDSFYAQAEQFAKGKGDRALWFTTRAGIFPTWLSMGAEAFSVALYEDRPFVEEILDIYTDWSLVVAERVCQLGFDVYASTDDMAFKTQTFFSPKILRELVMPRYRRLQQKVTLPWVMHSDGNLRPFLEDLLSLGLAGLHPNEKGAMDIQDMKRDYGQRICLLGNVDLNILGMGTIQDVDEEVRGLIRDVGPGGGYIVTSGNSLAAYVKPENCIALSRAVQRYGEYPLRTE
jgi:uroporphyrinogen decarboxylase